MFELLGFLFELTHLYRQNTKRENISAYIHNVLWLLTPLYIAVLVLRDTTLPIYVHLTWIPPSFEKQQGKYTRNIYFVKTHKESLERDLLIFSRKPTLSVSKILTEEWKIFFFVALFSNNVSNIVWLFSRLLNTKSCTKLNTSNQTSNSLQIHFEFSASKSLPK